MHAPAFAGAAAVGTHVTLGPCWPKLQVMVSAGMTANMCASTIHVGHSLSVSSIAAHTAQGVDVAAAAVLRCGMQVDRRE
jgi:hypothetical protein